MIKLLFLHFLADFICQPREMGKKKSTDIRWLAGHLLIQFMWFLPFTNWKFALANALVHGLIDWNIWKLYKATSKYRIDKDPFHPLLDDYGNNWKYYDDHLFYTTIGLDQFLHISTIVIILQYIPI